MSIFTINNNIASINTQRHINNTSLGLSKSLEKLSSGLRINTGADGPADLVISEQLRSHLGGIKAATRNSQEAMNFISVAEGALSEVSTILESMSSKAVHAANVGVVTDAQIASDQGEIDAAVTAIDRIIQNTQYNGNNVFGGGALTFHIGPGGDATADEDSSFSTGGLSTTALGINALDLATDAAGAVGDISLAVGTVASLRGYFGSYMKHTLQSNINSLNVRFENVTAIESYVRDTNMAEEVSNYTKHQILLQAGMSVLAQSNVSSQSVLQLLG